MHFLHTLMANVSILGSILVVVSLLVLTHASALEDLSLDDLPPLPALPTLDLDLPDYTSTLPHVPRSSTDLHTDTHEHLLKTLSNGLEDLSTLIREHKTRLDALHKSVSRRKAIVAKENKLVEQETRLAAQSRKELVQLQRKLRESYKKRMVKSLDDQLETAGELLESVRAAEGGEDGVDYSEIGEKVGMFRAKLQGIKKLFGSMKRKAEEGEEELPEDAEDVDEEVQVFSSESKETRLKRELKELEKELEAVEANSEFE